MTTLEELAALPFSVGLWSVSPNVFVPGSSPRALAASVAARKSVGIFAWIEVISLACRAKDS